MSLDVDEPLVLALRGLNHEAGELLTDPGRADAADPFPDLLLCPAALVAPAPTA